MRAETSLLSRAGVDESLTKLIARYCEDTREGVRLGELDGDKFHAALEVLRDRVCGVPGMLIHTQDYRAARRLVPGLSEGRLWLFGRRP